MAKYDQRVVLEALHNCIAHQDYARSGRVVVTERPDRLVLENEGGFFEGQPPDYIGGHKTPRRYRNPFLAQAMAELNMIDTMGYGIHEMHKGQARRYLPLPDYDLSEPGAVRMTIYGGVVDPAYSRLLMQKTDLPLADVLALDRVQKRLPVDDAVARRLRAAGLIEGRKPHYHVSAAVAQATAANADYIRMRAQDDVFYAKLLTDYLDKFGEASRAENQPPAAGQAQRGTDPGAESQQNQQLADQTPPPWGDFQRRGGQRAPVAACRENCREKIEIRRETPACPPWTGSTGTPPSVSPPRPRRGCCPPFRRPCVRRSSRRGRQPADPGR